MRTKIRKTVEIYKTTQQNISIHINNIYRDNELDNQIVQNKRKLLEGKGKISHQEAIERAEKEFEIYRDREMKQLESDFDKMVKMLKENNKDN